VIAASARFVDYFRYESRPAIFSSVVMPSDIARFSRTLEVVTEERSRRYRLHQLAARLRAGLRGLGYDISPSDSQIVPLVAGPEERTAVLRDALESRGVFGSVFSAPATPKNRSLVRLCVHTGLSEADIDRIVEVCAEIRDIVRPDQWPALARPARQRAPAVARRMAAVA
jgi:CAI-1 autoinducer synthase